MRACKKSQLPRTIADIKLTHAGKNSCPVRPKELFKNTCHSYPPNGFAPVAPEVAVGVAVSVDDGVVVPLDAVAVAAAGTPCALQVKSGLPPEAPPPVCTQKTTRFLVVSIYHVELPTGLGLVVPVPLLPPLPAVENRGMYGACPPDVVAGAGVCADTMPTGIARDAIKRERCFMVHS